MEAEPPSYDNTTGKVLQFRRSGSAEIQIGDASGIQFTISDYSAKPKTSPLDFGGVFSFAQGGLTFKTYQGSLRSFKISDSLNVTVAGNTEQSSSEVSLVVDNSARYLNEFMDSHQHFRFSVSYPPIQFVVHEVTDPDGPEIKGKFEFAAVGGNHFRWMHDQNCVDEGGVYELKLQVFKDGPKERWEQIGSAIGTRELFLGNTTKPKGLFSRGSSSASAVPREIFGSLTLEESSAFDWKAQSNVLQRIIVATLWAVWYEDLLNPTNRLDQILKERRTERIKQLRANDQIARSEMVAQYQIGLIGESKTNF
ncbi:hypothetical protein HK100_007655 [Physocladia obscura]|uniref:Uncharacterized protein n=1 Tax=Physocladia obscura TaxID=109957 RepID=A0AAD5X858_9FUNG|nr:hypothetical protein HK100_007655 [Physocladia obscura]